MTRSLLERWLSQRVGYCVRLDARDVGRLLYDGKVFYDLLASYGVVNIEMFGGIPGRGQKSEQEAFRCLAQLCDAFRFLNVDADEEYLRGISKRNGPFAVRLLYQLYMKLEDKQFLDLLAPKRDDKYDRDNKDMVVALRKLRRRDPGDGDLLVAEREMNIIKQYEDARRRIIKHCAEDVGRRREELNRARDQYTPIDMKAGGEPSYLSTLRAIANQEGEEAFDLDPREYVESLKAKERLRKNCEYKAQKMTPQPVVDVWADILERMEGVFKSTLKTRTDHQADYEKFHALKWSGAHHKFKRFFETKVDRYVDSDEEQHSDHVVRNEILRKGGEAIGKKQEAMWKLHHKLWAKKKRQRKRCNYEMCRHIVQDLVDILMKVLLYRYENKRGLVPRKFMNEWKEGFLKCELTLPPPRVTEVESSIGEEEAHPEDEVLMDLLKDRDFDSEIFIDREVIKLLNEFNMHCYIYLVGPWDPLKWPEWEPLDENLMVNGFIVHRLLETKYPLPKGYQDPQFDFKFKAAVGTIKDPNTAYIYNSIRNLMSKQDMVVLDIIEPMNFCLNAYHAETAAIEEQEEAAGGADRRASKRKSEQRQSKQSRGGSQASQRRQSKRQSTARKSTGGSKQQRKSMGAKQRKSMGAKSGGSRKSNAGGRKSMGGGGKRKSTAGGGAGGKASPEPKALSKGISTVKRGRDKAVQCPSIDSLVPRVNHSAAGLLGKDVFAFMNAGRPVSDILTGKMLIEYLKAKKSSIKSLALLSYPLTVSQAVLLEFLMTGRPLKTAYKINPDIEKFIQDELRPQPYLDTRTLVDFENIFSPDLQVLSKDILEVMADPNTAEIVNSEHKKLADKPDDLEAVNAVVTIVASELLKEQSAKKLIPDPGVENTIIETQSDKKANVKYQIDKGADFNQKEAKYPGWELKCYNERTPTRRVLADKIRTEAYNLGRFRPELSREAYEKIKAHVLALLAWIRSERKYKGKPVADEDKILGETKEEIFNYEDEQTEYDSKLPTVEPKKNVSRPMNVTIVDDAKLLKNVVLKPEEYERPISYVDLLKLRSSEIMPRPNKDQMEIHFTTSSCFTKYVKCLTKAQAKKEEDDYQARKLKYDKFMEVEIDGEEFLLDPIVELHPDTFYKVYGKKEVFDFNFIDYDSIVRLCRMLIDEPDDDDDPARKPSVLLFDIDALKKLKNDLPGSKKRSSTKTLAGKRQSSGGLRKSSSRKSTGGKRKSTARKSTGGKRQSTASKRQSNANKRQSAAGKKRQSAAGKRQSAAGKRQSAAGKRQSAAGKRQSAAGKRQSTGGKNTRRSTTMKGGEKKDSVSSPKVAEGKAMEEEIVEVEVEEELPPLVPPSPPPHLPVPPPPPPPPPLPGEDGWVYVEEIIPDIYQIYLATTWETVEFEYLSNLLHLFYLMRVHDNKVIPYRNFVRHEMESKLIHTDKRMETVTAFQKAFNDVKPKFRRKSDIKRSLHCRIYALYNDLIDIADVKRNTALARRDAILHQRWTTKHLFTLANLFLNLIQIETDRTIGSLQLIHDYYFAMLQKPPSKARLELLDVPKLHVPKREESILTTQESPSKKVLLPWEKIKEEPPVPEYVTKAVDTLDYLLNHSFVKCIDPNPTYPLVSRGVDLANTRANELFDYYEDLILDYELGRELRPKILRRLSLEEERERKKQEKAFRKMLARRKQKRILERSPSDGRDSQPRKIRKKKPDMDLEEEEAELYSIKPKFHIDALKLQMVDRLKWEWLVAVQNEINRLRFRLNLIQRRAEADLDEVLTVLKTGFDEFFHDIGWQYRREVKAIEQVIEAFKVAANLEVDIPVPMVLDNDQFYFGKYPINELYPEIPPPSNTPIIIIPEEFTFTVEQLNNFIRKIEDVSPDGIIERCFVDILEDMVTFNREMNYEFLPPGWSELTRNDIKFLVEQAFGSDYVVNWREFWLFCSGLRYPTVEEMVEMRMRFREADEYGFENIQFFLYMNIPLWFEKDLYTEEEVAWGQQMKKLLFKLFRTSRKEINYTELLLTLCKGKQPEEGFGKALSLMLGVGYIFWPDPPDWIHPRHVVDYILIQLLHDVIIKADYMTVTDFVPEEEEDEKEESIPELAEEEVWGEVDLPQILTMVDEHLEEEVEEEAEVIDKYKQILWRTCVPYEACLALLFVALRFWDLPPSHMLRQIDVETGLKKLFSEQGVGSHMKAHKLAQSKLIKDIFHNTSAFKECNIPEMVYSIVLSKRYVIGAKSIYEEKAE